MAPSSDRITPKPSHGARVASSRNAKSRNADIVSASRNVPSGAANLSAFHSAGLWLAVTSMPPNAPAFSTANMSVGVATIPRSTTEQPTDVSPAETAAVNMGPDVRESRPMMISVGASPGAPPALPARRTKDPNDAANAQMKSGVNGSPILPLKPDTLTTSPSGIVRGMYSLESLEAWFMSPSGTCGIGSGKGLPGWVRLHQHYPVLSQTVNDFSLGLHYSNLRRVWAASTL